MRTFSLLFLRVSFAALISHYVFPAVSVFAQSSPPIVEDKIRLLLERLEAQERQIDELRAEVLELRKGQQREVSTLAVQEPPPSKKDYTPREKWGRQAEESEYPDPDYDNPEIELVVSGQINQATNIAGDGDDTKVYFVDNDVSNSRIRLSGISNPSTVEELGVTFEMAFSPNPSSSVSQEDERADDNIQVRRAEVFIRDERFGRLMYGQGSAAADDAADYDLSLVAGPIMYSGVADIAGGLRFTDGRNLTDITIADAFYNFDSFRMNRIRYDTPHLWGPVQVSASAGSNQRWDAAVTFGADYGEWTGVDLGAFTGLGAISIFDPNEGDEDFRVAGSWSTLHDKSGVSLTLSGGFDEGRSGHTPYNLYGKLG